MIVGRTAELGLLRRLTRSAAAGAGGAALVEGIVGVGKSTLLRALVDEAPALRVLWGRAPEDGGAPPWWPWREVAAAAGWALDWSVADPWSLWAAVADAAASTAAATPLLILLDDLHAADDDTVRMTSYLARRLADTPVALVVGARPDDRLAGLARVATVVVLGPLDDTESESLIDRHAVGNLDAERRRAIREAAEGNPLVLCELARSPGAGVLPSGVRIAIGQRVAPLDPDARLVLELASVLGRRFEVDDLARLADRADDDLLATLGDLRGMGLVDGHGARWAFSHQVVRDVVHDAIPEPRRLDAHRRAAAALAGTDRTAEVANHLLAAVPTVAVATAVAAARAAATEAAAGGAHAESAAVLGRALDLVTDPRVRLDLLLDVADAHLAAGAVALATAGYTEAADLASRLRDPHRRARATLGRAERVGTGSSVVELRGELAAGAEASAMAGDEHLAVRLLARRAALRAADGDDRGALAEARAVVERARALDDPATLAVALTALHVASWAAGSEVESAAVSEELVTVAAASGDLDQALDAAIARMVDALRTGDLDAFDGALAGADAVAARSGSPRHRFFVLTRRATRSLVAGRLSEARQLLDRAAALGAEIEEPDAIQVHWGAQFLVLAELNESDALLEMAAVLAEAAEHDQRLLVVEANLRLAAGQVEEARARLAAHIDGLAPIDHGSGDLAWSVLMAIVAAGVGDADLAAAVELHLAPHRGRLVVNAGAVTFCGVVDHWLGLLAATQGRRAEAVDLLDVAVDRYTAMGADHLLRSARAARDALSGPTDVVPPPVPLTEAVLRPAGGGWEVGWAGRTTVLPDARGLHHLHTLVVSPGREVHAADLVAPGAAALIAGQARQALLDDTAKAAYRRRIRDLQAQEAAADAAGDAERSTVVRTELDALLDELRRAVGLGGRDRQPANDAERARVAVRKAITTTLTRLAEHDPAFAAHLRTAVRTGARCRYEPDPTVTVRWTTA